MNLINEVKSLLTRATLTTSEQLSCTTEHCAMSRVGHTTNVYACGFPIFSMNDGGYTTYTENRGMYEVDNGELIKMVDELFGEKSTFPTYQGAVELQKHLATVIKYKTTLTGWTYNGVTLSFNGTVYARISYDTVTMYSVASSIYGLIKDAFNESYHNLKFDLYSDPIMEDKLTAEYGQVLYSFRRCIDFQCDCGIFTYNDGQIKYKDQIIYDCGLDILAEDMCRHNDWDADDFNTILVELNRRRRS